MRRLLYGAFIVPQLSATEPGRSLSPSRTHLRLSDNLFLASLSATDIAAIQPHISQVRLEHKRVLFEQGAGISTVYFPISGVISIVVALSTGETIEAAMIGKEGTVGAAAALGMKIAVSRAIVQMPGEGLACDAGTLRQAAMQSPTLLSKLIRHEQTMLVQAQQSAACLAAHQVEARLCRWLLRARDLSGSDTLLFTQEFLAEMLGVRRTSVTLVATALQQAGLIKYSRGRVQILNVEALRETACECYDTAKSSYDRLMSA
jgi:CRP-like cAMP-binding protein